MKRPRIRTLLATIVYSRMDVALGWLLLNGHSADLLWASGASLNLQGDRPGVRPRVP